MLANLSLSSINTASIAKIFEVIIVLLFLIYSLLTMREVELMNRSLITSVAPIVKIVAIIQLAVGIFVLVLILK